MEKIKFIYQMDKDFEKIVLDKSKEKFNYDRMVIYSLIFSEIIKFDKNLKKLLKNEIVENENINITLINFIKNYNINLGTLDWFLNERLNEFVEDDIIKKYF